MKKIIFIVTTLLLVGELSAQQLHAWVYFTDKPQEQAFLDNPTTMLTQRALDRKQRHGITLDERDVPMNQTYVATIKQQTGIDYRTQSKWNNCVHVVGQFEDIEALNNLDFVERVDYADQSKSASQIELNQFKEDLDPPLDYGSATNQIEMIALDELHDAGHIGTDVIIAVTDSGFPGVDTNTAFEQMRSNRNLLGGYDFVDGDESIYGNNFHGARVLSIMGASRDTQFEGSAPDASYYLYRTEDETSETPVEMSYWVAAAERADSLGVDVVNVSLGYLQFANDNESLTYEDMNGSSFISRGAEIAAAKGLLVVTSAGNFGRVNSYPYIAAPADADGVFTIGSVTANESKSDFSSIGPTFDGRIKPDVVAQGSSTILINESDDLRSGNGTSYSSPVIAGAMASLVGAFPDRTPQELMEAVRQSATQADNPDNQLGYGIPDFGAVFNTLSNDFVQQPKDFKYYVRSNILTIVAGDISVSKVSIFNLQGQLLLNNATGKSSFDLNTLSSGIYIVALNDGLNSFKIVID
ncbi:S8 family serine peptidase [Nonlabens ponticola]|uniref:T9SS type A sorting domain-containing protein n=1 Tax=Nonlabens ponticola TaxID=2496866 RepID=A0A3S9MZT3_9FLAO|nr:S8 family serine peptidase [Nonlabens ponticola]AZQ44776.1 T9SS type A sorting domain-containing protein [Nonlabens ponticola]